MLIFLAHLFGPLPNISHFCFCLFFRLTAPPAIIEMKRVDRICLAYLSVVLIYLCRTLHHLVRGRT